MYDARETELSQRHLQEVVQQLDEPVCIIGGWAVYFTVNQRYKVATGRDYLGSRDIDLGFDNASTLQRAIHILEGLGFQAVAYRWRKKLEFETGRTLTKEEARQRPQHQLFPIDVDVIIAETSATIRAQLGFAPIDEPLLRQVFAGQHTCVAGFGRQLLLPTPAVLLATKLKTIGRRDQRHKRVKDLCDIAALLLYAGVGITELITQARELTKERIAISKSEIATAADATGIPADLIRRLVGETKG
jgi:hypothetical protein